MSERPYTADELEEGVHSALKDHNVEAAVDILKVLAAVDVERASRLINDLQLALAVAVRVKSS